MREWPPAAALSQLLRRPIILAALVAGVATLAYLAGGR